MFFGSQNIRNPGFSIALGLIAVAAGYLTLSPSATQPSGAPQFLSAAEAMAQSALADPEFVIGDQQVDGAALFQFYLPRNSQLAWSENGKATANAETALRALTNAGEHGLDSSRYHLAQLVYPLDFVGHTDAAVYDLLLTDAVLRYARDVRIGQGAPAAGYGDVDLPPQTFDPVVSLGHALDTSTLADFLGGLAPPHLEYRRLMEALATHGENNEHVARIKANMERWRWLPRRMESRYIMINVADATLQLIEDGRVVLNSKVIVGKPTTPTPILRTEARGLTVNPPWNVPSSIARNEILPKLRRNPDYLVSQHMILLDGPTNDPHGTHIDWKKISPASVPYRLQQIPGSDNALGIVKFEMPNRFDVYLHDTSERNLFARSSRTLSHGCIRVEAIQPLAKAVLAGSNPPALEQLDEAIRNGKTTRFPLKQPLPVYVVYWTAFPGADGTMQFRPDVYGRDWRLDRHQSSEGRRS